MRIRQTQTHDEAHSSGWPVNSRGCSSWHHAMALRQGLNLSLDLGLELAFHVPDWALPWNQQITIIR